MFRKKNRVYVTLTREERQLAKIALLDFYNKLVAAGNPTEDVAALLRKVIK